VMDPKDRENHSNQLKSEKGPASYTSRKGETKRREKKNVELPHASESHRVSLSTREIAMGSGTRNMRGGLVSISGQGELGV